MSQQAAEKSEPVLSAVCVVVGLVQCAFELTGFGVVSCPFELTGFGVV